MPVTEGLVDQWEGIHCVWDIMEKVKEAGGKVLREPSDAFWGGRTSYFADPENNIWEVAWNPSAVFDERGAMIEF